MIKCSSTRSKLNVLELHKLFICQCRQYCRTTLYRRNFRWIVHSQRARVVVLAVNKMRYAHGFTFALIENLLPLQRLLKYLAFHPLWTANEVGNVSYLLTKCKWLYCIWQKSVLWITPLRSRSYNNFVATGPLKNLEIQFYEDPKV